jgi:hypothetical protein
MAGTGPYSFSFDSKVVNTSICVNQRCNSSPLADCATLLCKDDKKCIEEKCGINSESTECRDSLCGSLSLGKGYCEKDCDSFNNLADSYCRVYGNGKPKSKSCSCQEFSKQNDGQTELNSRINGQLECSGSLPDTEWIIIGTLDSGAGGCSFLRKSFNDENTKMFDIEAAKLLTKHDKQLAEYIEGYDNEMKELASQEAILVEGMKTKLDSTTYQKAKDEIDARKKKINFDATNKEKEYVDEFTKQIKALSENFDKDVRDYIAKKYSMLRVFHEKTARYCSLPLETESNINIKGNKPRVYKFGKVEGDLQCYGDGVGAASKPDGNVLNTKIITGKVMGIMHCTDIDPLP